MSEMESAAPVTESAASTSTADVAASVIETFEQTESAESGIEASEPTETPPAESAAAEVSEPAKDLTPEEQLLAEFGFKQAFKPDGREHYIPRSKVLQMIGSGLKRGQEKWTSEKSTIESQAKELRSHLDSLVASVKGDPRAFLSELATHDPRYRVFLEPPPERPPDIGADMPTADYELPDGTRTYSLQGIQKQLIPWLTQAITKQVKADALKELDSKLTEREQRARDKQTAAERQQGRRDQIMAEAQTWPLFGQIAADGKLTPFQQEVVDVFMADKSLDLRAAYMKVALPRLTEDDTKKRERLLKEIKEGHRASTVPRLASETPGVIKPASTADIARQVLTETRGR